MIICGDALTELRKLPDESVHGCVTSPPYWGLRDYGTAKWEGGDPECDHKDARLRSRFERGFKDGDKQATNIGSIGTERRWADTCPSCGAHRIDSQLGLERTPEEYVTKLVEVFREVKRVLRKDATLWLNLGDSYAQTRAGGNDGVPLEWQRPSRANKSRVPKTFPGLKAKDLVGIPWRVAFALQADGWWLRSDIIWAKPNPMPESVTDRPTRSHEYIFLMSKNAKYYFDQEAVKEKSIGIWNSAEDWASRQNLTAPELAKGADRKLQRTRGFGTHHPDEDKSGRNIRSVWTITTKPFKEAHFATFPPDLPERCIKAGTSEKGVCPKCGAPWAREVKRQSKEVPPSTLDRFGTGEAGVHRRIGGQYQKFLNENPHETVAWRPSCVCNAGDPISATVLDPFFGAGTVGVVAKQLGRDFIGIELSPKYCEMAEKRIAGIAYQMEISA